MKVISNSWSSEAYLLVTIVFGTPHEGSAALCPLFL